MAEFSDFTLADKTAAELNAQAPGWKGEWLKAYQDLATGYLRNHSHREDVMQDVLNLIETVPGQVALEVFSRKAGMAPAAMRFELTVNAPLAQYFCQIVAQSMEAA